MNCLINFYHDIFTKEHLFILILAFTLFLFQGRVGNVAQFLLNLLLLVAFKLNFKGTWYLVGLQLLKFHQWYMVSDYLFHIIVVHFIGWIIFYFNLLIYNNLISLTNGDAIASLEHLIGIILWTLWQLWCASRLIKLYLISQVLVYDFILTLLS